MIQKMKIVYCNCILCKFCMRKMYPMHSRLCQLKTGTYYWWCCVGYQCLWELIMFYCMYKKVRFINICELLVNYNLQDTSNTIRFTWSSVSCGIKHGHLWENGFCKNWYITTENRAHQFVFTAIGYLSNIIMQC